MALCNREKLTASKYKSNQLQASSAFGIRRSANYRLPGLLGKHKIPHIYLFFHILPFVVVKPSQVISY